MCQLSSAFAGIMKMNDGKLSENDVHKSLMVLCKKSIRRMTTLRKQMVEKI